MGRTIQQNNANQISEPALPSVPQTAVIPQASSSAATSVAASMEPNRFLIALNESPEFKKIYETLKPQQKSDIESLCQQRYPIEIKAIFEVVGSKEFQNLDQKSKTAVREKIQTLRINDVLDIGWRAENYKINPNVELKPPTNPAIAEIVELLFLLGSLSGGSAAVPKGSPGEVPPAERSRYEKLCRSRTSDEAQTIAEIICSEAYRFLNEAGREKLAAQIETMKASDLSILSRRLPRINTGNPEILDKDRSSPAGAAISGMFLSLTALPPELEQYAANRTLEQRLAISGMLNTPVNQKFSPAEQQMLLGIIGKCETRELWDLATLHRLINPDGAPSLLLEKDSGGKTMLASLHDIYFAQTVAGPDLAKDYAEFKREALRTIARPGLVTQGGKGTCAATDPMRKFIAEDPAEMARVIRDLALTGSVKFRDGNVAPIEADAIANDGSRRTIVERMVQSTFMEYANGPNNYRNDLDQSFGSSLSGSGLTSEMQARLMSSFYGRKYKVLQGTSEQLWDAVHYKSINNPQDIYTVATLRWDDNRGRDGYHSVSVYQSGPDTVTISNPWGREISAGDKSGPKRTSASLTEFPEGMERIETEEFKRRLTGIVIPAAREKR